MFVEHQRGVVQHRVDADELLEDRQHDADDEHEAAEGEQLAGGLVERGVDFREHDLALRPRSASLVSTSRAFSLLALHHEPARRLGHEEQQQQEQCRRECAQQAACSASPVCTQFASPSPLNFLMKQFTKYTIVMPPTMAICW